MIPYDSFKCSCCGENKLNWHFFYELCNLHCILEMIHGCGNVSIELESGYRCWNKHMAIYAENNLGSPPRNSLHLSGLAADIRFKAHGEVIKPLRIACLLQSHLIPLGISKIRGIGPMVTSIHLDMRDAFEPVTWIRKNGQYVYNIDFHDELNKGLS